LKLKDLGIDDLMISKIYDAFTKDGNAEKEDLADKFLKDE